MHRKIERAEKLRQAVNRMIHQRYHQLATKYQLTLEQFHLLIELDELAAEANDSPSIGLMAERLGQAQNTLSEKVSRLQKKGLVDRVRDINDKRVSRVVLSNQGKELLKRINYEVKDGFLFEALRRFSEPELDCFLQGMERLLSHLQGTGEGGQ